MNPFAWLSEKLFSRPTCEEVNRFLAEYVEGTLPRETVDRFNNHMSRCKCCGPYLESYRATIDLVRTGEEIELPDELVEHTIAFLRTQIPQS